jgi:hypothetical protein
MCAGEHHEGWLLPGVADAALICCWCDFDGRPLARKAKLMTTRKAAMPSDEKNCNPKAPKEGDPNPSDD